LEKRKGRGAKIPDGLRMGGDTPPLKIRKTQRPPIEERGM